MVEIILHGRRFMLFSQFIFSILHVFSLLTTKKFFWISLDKGFKKQKRGFLFSGISSDVLLISFYVSLFIFEDIFCWIARVTFRWILVLFSFCLNSHNTNYVCKECKKEPKTSWAFFHAMPANFCKSILFY